MVKKERACLFVFLQGLRDMQLLRYGERYMQTVKNMHRKNEIMIKTFTIQLYRMAVSCALPGSWGIAHRNISYGLRAFCMYLFFTFGVQIRNANSDTYIGIFPQAGNTRWICDRFWLFVHRF